MARSVGPQAGSSGISSQPAAYPYEKRWGVRPPFPSRTDGNLLLGAQQAEEVAPLYRSEDRGLETRPCQGICRSGRTNLAAGPQPRPSLLPSWLLSPLAAGSGNGRESPGGGGDAGLASRWGAAGAE